MREVFRKLASALHPDREAKTTLMQRVNQAYASNDLLTLLALQLQIEQVDSGHMATAESQRLKHYNKVLADQLSGLHVETGRVERDFRMDFGLAPGHCLKPLKLGELQQREVQRLRFELAETNRELALLDDVAATRRWLQRERQRQQDEALDMELFFRPSEW